MSNVLNLNCQWEIAPPETILIQSGVTKVSFNCASASISQGSGYIHIVRYSSSQSATSSYYSVNRIDLRNATKIVANAKYTTDGTANASAYVAIFDNDYWSMAGGQIIQVGTASPIVTEYDVSGISGSYYVGVLLRHGTLYSTAMDLYDLKVV